MSETTQRWGGPGAFTAVWRRRKWLGLSAFAAIVSAAAGIAAFLPDLYRGTATVLVERLDVTESLVRPGDIDEMETRLQTITAKTLSRARLENLIQRFSLYRGLRMKGASTEAVIEQMRRDIRLELTGADPSGGQGATVSFALRYWSDDPRTAAAVANALAASYVEDSHRSREIQAASSARFLKAELDEAKARLDQSSAEQARLTGLRDSLVRQLASLGHGPSSGLAGPAGSAGNTRLATLRQELIELRTRLKDHHPEVVQKRNEIQTLEAQVMAAVPAPAAGPPDNGVAGRLKGAAARVKDALAQADAGLMSSDFATARDRYLALVKWYDEARLNENMEREQQGAQFAILDPAVVPDEPTWPNRFRILFGGMAIALGLALGVVVLAERRDTSFHTLDDLIGFTRVPVLASIPRIATTKGTRQRRLRFLLGATVAGLGLPLVVGISYLVARWGGPVFLTISGGHD